MQESQIPNGCFVAIYTISAVFMVILSIFITQLQIVAFGIMALLYFMWAITLPNKTNEIAVMVGVILTIFLTYLIF